VQFGNHCFFATVNHGFDGVPEGLELRAFFAGDPEAEGGYEVDANYYTKWGADAALLPTTCPERRKRLVMKDVRPRTGKQVWGIASMDFRAYALHCRAIETAIHSGKREIMADCGGSGGASGTALLNRKGFGVGMHWGSGLYPHSADVNPTKRLSDYLDELNVTCQVNRATGQLREECFSSWKSIISLSSRNPTSILVPGADLWAIYNEIEAGTANLKPVQPHPRSNREDL
jgi:hypothetical protein